MLGDLDNKSKYLESIDNGEENLEIRLENLKKNDWKRMNSPTENDNRLGLVHMGFECSLHDIYNPQFSSKSIISKNKQKSENTWKEEDLWMSEDEQILVENRKNKRKLSLSKSPDKILIKKDRWSVDDNEAYQLIKQDKGRDAEACKLYKKVKGHFSDYYDIEFIDQVWQMRDMRGNNTLMRTPSPNKSRSRQITYSSNSKFNVSRTYSHTDSLTIKLSCINNPVSELGSEWNESVMGILDHLPDSHIQPVNLGKGEIIQHKLNPLEYKNLLDGDSQRKSNPNFNKSDKLFQENSAMRRRKNANQLESGKKVKSNSQTKQKRFRKRKGISGTNSLSEMTGMFDDDLSNFMSNLDDQIPLFQDNPPPQIDPIPNTERPETIFNLTTQTSKNWDQDKGLNGPTIVTKSIDEQELKNNLIPNKLPVESTMKSEVIQITNISEQIKQIASKKFKSKESSKERLSHREMAVSTERGLNFLIENWKELGTLQNPPNTLEQFSGKKENTNGQSSNFRNVLRSMQNGKVKEPMTSRQEQVLVNPEQIKPNCFMKKGGAVSNIKGQKGGKFGLLNKIKTPIKNEKKTLKKTISKESNGESKKKEPSNRSTPQNGKKVQVHQKYPFSNFYLPNAKKVFTKSSSNFSKIHKQASGMVTPIGEHLKTISDNFLFENNPPKSHRQFSNKKRLRNDALKKKLKMNSKKKNSKELQKILEFKKNLVTGRKVESKVEDSLRRMKSKKLESKCFQSDRNLSIQKSNIRR